MSFEWTDKTDGKDYIKAADVNSIARELTEHNEQLTEHNEQLTEQSEKLTELEAEVISVRNETEALASYTDGTKANTDLSNVTDEIFRAKAAGVGISATADNVFARVGFSKICDYKASAADGYTALKNAVAAATDGDVIVVEAGAYTGTARLTVDKDLTFIAEGKAVIKFPVYTSGGGTFDYETWSWTSVEEQSNTVWRGFTFENTFSVGINFDPDDEGYYGTATAADCVFKKSATVTGDFAGCRFEGSADIGHYYANSGCVSTFTDCVFAATVYSYGGYDTFTHCDFHLSGEPFYITTWSSSAQFAACRVYNVGRTAQFCDAHGGYDIYLRDTLVFANGANNYGDSSKKVCCYLLKPSEQN